MKPASKKYPLTSQITMAFEKIEMAIAVLLSMVILVIALVAMFNIVFLTYDLVVQNLLAGEKILYTSYSIIFARMITLLISLEFMNSVLKILKTRNIRILASDVALITVLAICRKLIVLDYQEYEAQYFIAFALLLIALGALYAILNNRVPFVNKKPNRPPQKSRQQSS